MQADQGCEVRFTVRTAPMSPWATPFLTFCTLFPVLVSMGCSDSQCRPMGPSEHKLPAGLDAKVLGDPARPGLWLGAFQTLGN